MFLFRASQSRLRYADRAERCPHNIRGKKFSKRSGENLGKLRAEAFSFYSLLNDPTTERRITQHGRNGVKRNGEVAKEQKFTSGF